MYTRRVLPESHARVRKNLETLKARVETAPLEQGDRGLAVKVLESNLKSAGLFKGTVDSTFDAETARAVKQLQKKEKLAVTGEVNLATYREVRGLNLFVSKGFKKPAEQGQRGRDILAAEKQLSALGYRGAHPDGLYSRNTTLAVRRFQRAYGLKASGDIGESTAAKLRQVTTKKRTLGYVNGSARRITVTPVGNGKYMRTDAARSWLKLQAAAKRAGVSLSVTSGFRTMAEQKRLYALYLSGRGNLAARPGYSNHQGGISIDVGGVNSYGTRAFAWLSKNARKYGFVNDVGGEYWHWTYKR